MSGGHFDYIQYQIENTANRVQEEIDMIVSGKPDEFGYEPMECTKETLLKFKKTVGTLELAAKMLQRVDWFLSGDDGEESFHRRWKEEELPE